VCVRADSNRKKAYYHRARASLALKRVGEAKRDAQRLLIFYRIADRYGYTVLH